ncbi:MAG: succinate dehydrogenase cytochrome b subunit [Deltaproteobacteria bacterium]|nr:succinate dehydrogenase cytochrome b subunit [Deltaproteobacteria bacterium]
MSSASPRAAAGQPASGVSRFLGSTIGKKVVMAVTGFILFGFVLGHFAGNLQVYLGAEAFNDYAEGLRKILHGAGLWIARAGLLGAVAGHIWAATALTLQNRAARPVGYRATEFRESTYASRTMRYSGYILAFFILFHLSHLTLGTTHPDFIAGDAYHNFVTGFKNPIVDGFYIISMVLLGLHLRHGVWSFMQTLGWNHPRYNALRQTGAIAFAALITVGNILFPVMVLAGVIK